MIDAGGILATRRLEAFLAVLEYGGFSRAAERLGVAQPTVSQLVRSLEQSVGTELLVRSRGNVRPTPAGTALRPHAVELLAAAERAAEAVRTADRDARRHLRVAAGEALATHVLPPAVARLRQRLPGLLATFVVGDEARVVEALRTGEVDAALLTDRTEATDLTQHRYADGRLVLVASPDDELAQRRSVVPADLEHSTLVVRDLGTINRRELEQMLRRSDVEPRNRLVASSLEAVKRCVEAGLGVTLVPSIAVERELADGTLVELPLEETEGFDYGFVLCTRAGERPTPPVAALLEILRAGT